MQHVRQHTSTAARIRRVYLLYSRIGGIHALAKLESP